jgi:biotin transport system ATP-binding protein
VSEAVCTIRFDNVTLQRGERSVFEGLSLTLKERRVGLVGDNGSGKSSLLRLINGLLVPDAGSVIVEGLDTKAHRKDMPAHVGFVFQNPDHQILFPTVEEELAFALLEQGMSTDDAKRCVQQTLQENGCHDWAMRSVHELSEGQKQRVCLMAVLISTPRILLLDEPFSSLDLKTCHAQAKRLKDLPQTMIMASHHLEFLSDFERILWLDQGKIKEDGAPDEVLKAYRKACEGCADAHL